LKNTMNYTATVPHNMTIKCLWNCSTIALCKLVHYYYLLLLLLL